jgi:hypothetical protein
MLGTILLNTILKDIHRSFEFLFQRGYRVRDAYWNHNYPDWCVQLESKDCIIWMYWGRSQLFIYFTPIFASQPEKRIMLEMMVYYLSNEELFTDNTPGNFRGGRRKQLERAADSLKRYIDQIESCFSKNYNEFLNDFADLMRRYYMRTSPKY